AVDGKSCTPDPDPSKHPCGQGKSCVGTSPRDIPGYLRRMVWMNRPDPSDPSGKKRIFVDFTAESHLFDTRAGSTGGALGPASIGDIDNDGDTDVILGSATGNPNPDPTYYAPNFDPAQVMLNDGKGHFTIADSGELEATMNSWAVPTATLADFNAD